MARFITGNTFSTGNQVTASSLNDAVNNAKISTDSIDSTSFQIDTGSSGAKIQLKDSTGTSDGVTFSKLQQVAANTVLVRDDNSTGSVSAKAVADTQILIGDGTGFTAAALGGDVSMANDGAVTIAANAVEGSMILSSTTLQDGVKCADQTASDNSTKIANTKYVDAQVNLGTPNNRLRIKILPRDFGDTSAHNGKKFTQTLGQTAVASYDIPSGYKATEVVLRNQRTDITVYESEILDRTTATSKGSDTTTRTSMTTTTIDITDVTATDTNYLSIQITGDNNFCEVGGGYITLVAV